MTTIAMNSPEPISPSASTSSSGSPPPEEASLQPAPSYLSSLTSHLTTFNVRNAVGGSSSSSSKRRLPAGSTYGPGQSDRDPKTRKKTGDASRTGTLYEGLRETAPKKDKEELTDSNTVEWLRRGEVFKDNPELLYLTLLSEIGDPFLEPGYNFWFSWIVKYVHRFDNQHRT